MTDSLANGDTHLERLDSIALPFSVLLSLSIFSKRYGSVLCHWILVRGSTMV